MHNKITAAVFAVVVLALLGLEPDRLAAATDDFYAGKQVRIIVSSAPGGLLDLDARVVARHLPKHLPGNPSVIVQNMPGAGGAIMMAHLYNRAKPDGLTIGIIGRGQTLLSLLEEVEHDLSKMPALWGTSAIGVDLVGGELLKVKGPDDLVEADPASIAIAARARSDNSCIAGMLAMELLGIKGYRTVCAYPGTPPILSAVRRGEVTFFVVTDVSIMAGGAAADIVGEGMAVPIWQTGYITPDGEIRRSPTVKGEVPTFFEVYRKLHGQPPSGIHWDAYKAMMGLGMLSRSYIAPPGISEEQLNILRRSMAQLADDPDFVRDWERVSGQPLDATMVPAELVERLKNDFLEPAPWQDFLRNFVKQQ